MTVRALSARRRPLDTRPLAYALSRMHTSLLAALVDEHADPAARAAAADILDDLLAEAAPAGTGRFAIDQAWHIGWLLVAALMTAAGGAR